MSFYRTLMNWNNTVGQDDIVFHLGDFCLGGSAEWTKILDRLNGKIYLIMGNHDLQKYTARLHKQIRARGNADAHRSQQAEDILEPLSISVL